MDLASISLGTSQSNASNTIGTVMLSKSLSAAENSGKQLVEMLDSAAMQRSVNPHIGGHIDLSI